MNAIGKKVIIRLVVTVALILGIHNEIYAQQGEAGTQSVLNLGYSARALGIGRAYVAIADDPSAVFWNPSGLEFIPRISLTLFHTSLYEGTTFDFIGFAYPTLQFGTVGIGYARVAVGDIPVVDKFNIRQGLAHYEMSELYIAYAKKLPFKITTGLTFKIDRQEFDFTNLVTSGIGLDLGIMYRPQLESGLFRDLSIGFQFQNLIKPQLKLGAEREVLPNQFRIGILKPVRIGEAGKMNIALDYRKSEQESGQFHAGTEYKFREMGAIRLGYDQSNIAFGAGLVYKFMQIDYSFGNLSKDNEFSATHRFSVTFNLGKSREELFFVSEEKRKQRERELVEQTREDERERFISERLQKGKEYLDGERYLDAYAEFQQVVSVDPFNKEATALFDSTNNLIQSNLDQRLQQSISEAIDKELAEENKRFVQLHFDRGQVFLQKNQFTDALIEFNFALERSPEDPIITQAINTTQRRLNEQVRNLVLRGRQEFQQGNYSDALRILSEAMVLAPDDPQLQNEVNTLANRIKVQQYVQAALQYYEIADYQEALSLFEEALTLDPSNQTIQQYIEKSKRGAGAEDVKLDPEAERLYIVGTEYFLAGEYEEALKVWRGVSERYPFNKKIQDALKNAEDRLRRTRVNQ
jgi:tetratricopeptide (TPR) repeat protein